MTTPAVAGRPLRVLIVDDERLPRQRLLRLLEEVPNAECVGECANGRSTVEAIESLLPDLVLLDVRMPGMGGLDVARALTGHVPFVIFVTAFDEYALSAFEVHAIDYLLKPFTAERMRQAVARVRHDLERDQAAAARESTAALLDARAAVPNDAPAFSHRLTVRDRDAFVMLRAEEVDWIEAAANYVRVHARGRVFVLRGTMNALERRLDPRQFARIHRSTIVNVDRVREIRPEWHGDYDVVLADGRTLRLGRSYRGALLGR